MLNFSGEPGARLAGKEMPSLNRLYEKFHALRLHAGWLGWGTWLGGAVFRTSPRRKIF